MNDPVPAQTERIKTTLSDVLRGSGSSVVSQTDLAIQFETVAACRTARQPSAGGTTSIGTTVVIHQTPPF
jgi:hypothetical protein